MTTFTKEKCIDWIAALRSGKYQQGRNKLKYGNQCGTFYCCLGVGEAIGVLSRISAQETALEPPVLDLPTLETLVSMNDEEEKVFL